MSRDGRRIHLLIDEQHYERLVQHARAQRRSISAVVRGCIEQELGRGSGGPARPAAVRAAGQRLRGAAPRPSAQPLCGGAGAAQ